MWRPSVNIWSGLERPWRAGVAACKPVIPSSSWHYSWLTSFRDSRSRTSPPGRSKSDNTIISEGKGRMIEEGHNHALYALRHRLPTAMSLSRSGKRPFLIGTLCRLYEYEYEYDLLLGRKATEKGSG